MVAEQSGEQEKMIAKCKPKYIVCLAWLIATLIWGHTSFVLRVSMHGYSPCVAAALRGTVSTLVCLLLWRQFARDIKPTGRQIYLILIAGVLNGLGLFGVYFAGCWITGGLITTVLAMQPIIVTIMALGLGKKGIIPVNLLGATIAASGMYAIYHERISVSPDQGLAILLVIAGAIVFGVACFPMNASSNLSLFPRLCLLFASMSLVNWTGAAIEMVLVGSYAAPHSTSIVPTLAILYLGTIGNILPWAAFLLTMSEWGEVSATTIEFVIPIVALTMDFFFEKQPLHLGIIASSGIALVLIGVFLTNIRKRIPTQEAEQVLVGPQLTINPEQFELAGTE